MICESSKLGDRLGWMGNQAGVSLGIVNYNGVSHLPPLREAVRALEGEFDELLILDNASTDASLAWIDENWPEARVLRLEKNQGPGPARNALLEASPSPLLLLMDNDARPEPGVLRELLEVRRLSGNPAVVQSRVVFADEPQKIHYDGAHLHYVGLPLLRNFHQRLRPEEERFVEVDSFQAVCLLVDSKPLLEVGGFDPHFFFYFEDSDLSHRLRLLGERIVVAQKALTRHGDGTAGLSQRGSSYSKKRIYLHSRNRSLLVLKTYRLRSLFLLAPGALPFEFAGFALACQKGHPWAWFKGRLALVPLLPSILRARKELARLSRARKHPLRDRPLLRADPFTFLPSLQTSALARGLQKTLSQLCALWWRLVSPLLP
ncbi:MAG TPA: glycosyltransferase family 2 protein [Planctomycetes bacterium]|nr:glycosyltransferase family 2 protein [Planctomycetota bacterium]